MAGATGGKGGGDGPAPDWSGLLKWSLQHHDGTSTEPKAALSKEDKQFLESAMKEGVLDISKRLKEITATLSSHEGRSSDEIVFALEELQELCIDLDTALDLEIVGGVQTLAKLCSSKQTPAVQRAAARVAATVAQNNPRGQTAMIQEGLVPELITMIKNSEDASVAKASLWALSSICRGFPSGAALFISHGGTSAIEHCLKLNDLALSVKSIHVVESLAQIDPDNVLPNVVQIQGLPQTLAKIIDDAEDHIGAAEAAVGIIAKLTASRSLQTKSFLQQMCDSSQMGVRKALEKIQTNALESFCEQALEDARAILAHDNVI